MSFINPESRKYVEKDGTKKTDVLLRFYFNKKKNNTPVSLLFSLKEASITINVIGLFSLIIDSWAL
jgi:hypothetical protein